MAFPITAALLDFCVLAIVGNHDEYGYSITQKFQESINISESTLYPVLRRLQQSDLLETYDREFQGRNRRYYRITKKGRDQLGKFQQDWIAHKSTIDRLVKADVGGGGFGQSTQTPTSAESKSAESKGEPS